MEDSIYQRVKTVLIKELGVDGDDCTLDADIRDDLGADSLDMVMAIMEAEKEFGISIKDEDAERIHTVRDAVDLIKQYPQYRNY